MSSRIEIIGKHVLAVLLEVFTLGLFDAIEVTWHIQANGQSTKPSDGSPEASLES